MEGGIALDSPRSSAHTFAEFASSRTEKAWRGHSRLVVKGGFRRGHNTYHAPSETRHVISLTDLNLQYYKRRWLSRGSRPYPPQEPRGTFNRHLFRHGGACHQSRNGAKLAPTHGDLSSGRNHALRYSPLIYHLAVLQSVTQTRGDENRGCAALLQCETASSHPNPLSFRSQRSSDLVMNEARPLLSYATISNRVCWRDKNG